MTITAARIVAGAHLYPGADGIWRYYLPGDEFVRVAAPADLLVAAQRLLHQVPETGADEVDAEELGQLLDALARRGVLADPAPGGSPAGQTVLVDGDNPIGARVAQLLRGEVEVVLGPIDEGAVADADAVVACAGWLPDTRWRELDRVVRQPRHAMAHELRRGDPLVCGSDGGTRSHRRLRGRAGPAAGRLRGTRGVAGLLGVPGLDHRRASGAVAFGRCGGGGRRTDRQRHPDLARHRNRRHAGVPAWVAPATGEVSRHPVLPIPRVALREGS